MTADEHDASAHDSAGDNLAEYERKRDFTRTPEPVAERPASDGRRFVVQKHAARNLHYDLRLELDGVLKSWAVPKGPSLDPREKPLAVQTEDHPLGYAEFEGIIPAGEYGGGTVMVWELGEWEALGDPVEGLARGDLKFRLHGEKLTGGWALVRIKGEDGRQWLLIKKPDEAARPRAEYDVRAELPFSVLSGRGMEEIAQAADAVWTDGGEQINVPDESVPGKRGASSAIDPASAPGARRVESLPTLLAPQLAVSEPRAPDGDAWGHEAKIDGYRLLARRDGDEVRVFTRNGHDWTEVFPGVVRALGRLPVATAWFDGEVAVLDERGRPDFGALQRSVRAGARQRHTYFVFDLLFADGYDLRPTPLAARKALLEALFDAAPSTAPTLRYLEHLVGDGPLVFGSAAAMGLEGIVSKRLDAPYSDRRADTWRKIKSRPRQEFVVGGYTSGGAGGVLGALLLGVHDAAGRLVYAGRVGSGFRAALIPDLVAQLKAAERDDPPFVDPERDPERETVRWVEPTIIVEVAFAEWTRDAVVRQASFQGVRSDVAPRSVVREGAPGDAPPAPPPAVATPPKSGTPGDATIEGVRVSHPDRTVYPEARFTKRDVAEYYAATAERLLRFVAGRPLSLVRCPLGLTGDAFFQRHVGEGFPPSIRGIPLGTETEGEPYVLVDDAEGLVALVQMGVLEVHIWGSRVDQLERPDLLVFDLDPGEGIVWEHLVAAARFVRDVLAELGLVSFVKTSGGKGIHVVVPITRRTTWEDAKTFAHGVAKKLATAAPKNFVATMSKDFRRGRIYVDYLRNTRGATAVAPYSTRARPGGLVSTPLTWDELDASRPPSAFDLRTVRVRVVHEADPWGDFFTTKQTITRAMRSKLE